MQTQPRVRDFTRNFILTLFFCSLVTFLVFARFNYSLTGIDDANIYFVYARNLADGHGLVYNVGGERVEGFTSLLWTVICALAFRFSTQPELLLLIINIILVSLGIAVALTYLQHDFLGDRKNGKLGLLYSIVLGALLLTSPRYLVWNTVTLMENGLWSTLLLVTTIFTIKDLPAPRSRHAGFILLSILLILTRPESILWVMALAGIYWLRLAFRSNSDTALKAMLPWLICLGSGLAALTLFRLGYFGYPLPNTYYAKVSPSFAYNLQQGAIYLSKYFISDPVVLLSASAIVVAGLHNLLRLLRKQVPADGAFFLPFLAATGLLAPLITGGDHFGSFRLYQNIYPLEVLSLLYFVDRILPGLLKPGGQSGITSWRHPAIRWGSVLVVVLLLLSQFQIWDSIQSEMNIEFRVADYGRKNGALIQKLFLPLSKPPSLGVVTSGGIKYSYEGEVVDLMGLNNTTMAHNDGDRKGIKNHAAFDIPTFYELQPDIVWPTILDATEWQYSQLEVKESWENTEGLKGLFDQPEFLKLYTYAQVGGRTESKYKLVAWFKKELLRQLQANPDFRVTEYQYTP